MRLNKPKAIQGLTNIKNLEPIPSLSPREEWQRGEIVNAIKINLLIVYILYDAKMLSENIKDVGETRLIFNSYMTIIKRLFELMGEGYMMQKEFNQIKRDFKIKFDSE